MEQLIRAALLESSQLLAAMGESLASEVAEVTQRAIDCLRGGHLIAFCGNGGSASQAQHLAGELVGRFRRERVAFRAISLTTDTAVLTAIANDYGYEEVFRRQVEGLLEPGDMLVCLSTSGNAENILRAVADCKSRGILTVGLTGETGGKLAEIADLCLKVPHRQTSTIQEAHLAVGHVLCDLIEKSLAAR